MITLSQTCSRHFIIGFICGSQFNVVNVRIRLFLRKWSLKIGLTIILFVISKYLIICFKEPEDVIKIGF